MNAAERYYTPGGDEADVPPPVLHIAPARTLGRERWSSAASLLFGAALLVFAGDMWAEHNTFWAGIGFACGLSGGVCLILASHWMECAMDVAANEFEEDGNDD